MFTSIESKLILGLFLAILVVGGIGGLYFWYAEKRIATLEESNGKLTVSVDEQKKTITTIQDTVKRHDAQVLSLQNNVATAESKRRDLETMIQGIDFQTLAKKDRNALEIELNKETQDQFNNLVTITSPAGTVVTPKITNSKSSVQPPPKPPVGVKK